MNKDLIDLLPWGEQAVLELIEDAVAQKLLLKTRGPDAEFAGRTAALYFEKPSLRTRVTFEVAMNQKGGSALMLDAGTIGIGKRESLEDVARNLERWLDVLVCRTFSHSLVRELARLAKIPVINALTDVSHPCQAIAFAQTAIEHRGGLDGLSLVFVGDGNNVARSLAELAALTGMHFTLACPAGFELPSEFVREVQPLFSRRNRRFLQSNDPRSAVVGADFLYGDVWVSMGQEGQKDSKTSHFLPFQINAALLEAAGTQALVTHCLPAHRGEEITDDVMDGSKAVCFDEAENRLHAQKAVLRRVFRATGRL
ncbi:MAG TPA: ornithine carbamoyltransferase [Fibrobacteria bacterium]|nr:ornithine carbamoyltransferase [Fibrobacteria bacterium]HOX52579.1 ornithine carbamoyltransferase [Fibrobacteria bacterium]